MMRREMANLTVEIGLLEQEAKENRAGFKDELIAQGDADADDPLARLERLLRPTPEELLAKQAELEAKIDALRKAIGGGG